MTATQKFSLQKNNVAIKSFTTKEVFMASSSGHVVSSTLAVSAPVTQKAAKWALPVITCATGATIGCLVAEHCNRTAESGKETVYLGQTNSYQAAEAIERIRANSFDMGTNIDKATDLQAILQTIENTLTEENLTFASAPLNEACQTFVSDFIESARELKNCAQRYRSGQATKQDFIDRFKAYTKQEHVFCTQLIMQYMKLFNDHQSLLRLAGEILDDANMTVARLNQLQRSWRRQNLLFPNTPEDAKKLLETAKQLRSSLLQINECINQF